MLAYSKMRTKPSKSGSDPGAFDIPSASLTPYMIFVRHERSKVCLQHPTLSVREIVGKLSKQWQDMSHEQRQPYFDHAIELQARSEQQNRNIDIAAPPKKPMNPYMLYAQERRESVKRNNPNLPTRDICRQLGILWKTLSEEQKIPYERKAQLAKDEYEVAHKKWVEECNDMGVTPKKARKDIQKAKETDRKRARKTIKRAQPAFMYFSVKNRKIIAEKNPAWKLGDVSKELGRMWHQMTQEDKAPYMSCHEEDKERYQKELAKLNSSRSPKKKSRTQQQTSLNKKDDFQPEFQFHNDNNNNDTNIHDGANSNGDCQENSPHDWETQQPQTLQEEQSYSQFQQNKIENSQILKKLEKLDDQQQQTSQVERTIISGTLYGKNNMENIQILKMVEEADKLPTQWLDMNPQLLEKLEKIRDQTMQEQRGFTLFGKNSTENIEILKKLEDLEKPEKLDAHGHQYDSIQHLFSEDTLPPPLRFSKVSFPPSKDSPRRTTILIKHEHEQHLENQEILSGNIRDMN